MTARESGQRRTRIMLTDRDLLIFRDLGRYGVASLEQLHRRYWLGRERQTCLDRLLRLQAGGWLGSETLTLHGQDRRVFWCTPRVRRLFAGDVGPAVLYGRPPIKEIASLLKTADILQRLARYGEIAVTSERALKSLALRHGHRAGIADARVVFTAAITERRVHQRTLRRGVPFHPAAVDGRRPDPRAAASRPARQADQFGLGEGTYLIEVDGQYFGRTLARKVALLAATGEKVLWVVESTRRLDTVRRACAGHDTILPILLDDL